MRPELLFAKVLSCPVGVVVDRVAGDHDLERGLGSRLNGLGSHHIDEPGFIVQQPVPELSQPDRAGVGPQRLPGRLMGAQFVHDRGDRLGGLHRNGSDELTRRGVAHVDYLGTRATVDRCSRDAPRLVKVLANCLIWSSAARVSGSHVPS